MAEIFGREKLEVDLWCSRTGFVSNGYLNMGDIDNMLLDIEDSLNKSPLGGNGFVSQKDGALSDSLTDAQALWNYVDYLPYDLDEWVDHPFHLQVNNEALEYLATIDATKITTDNTVGLQGTSYTSGGGYHYTHVRAVSALSLGDFLGYTTADPGGNSYAYVTHDQSIKSFSDLFAAQYNNLVGENPDLSLDDFLQSILPKEFSVEKDVPLWKELLQTASDLTIILPILEAAQGYEFVTGDHLTQGEAGMKVVNAIIQAVSVAVTGGGALAASGGKGGASAMGKALAAMFISDLAAGSTAVLGNAMDLPPVLTAILALAAGVGSGKLANDWLFGSQLASLDLDALGDDIARVAKENNMTPDELVKILQTDPGQLNASQASLVDDIFRNLDSTGGLSSMPTYQYNMIENPGPLADINPGAAATFESGKYNVEVLTEPRIVYRGGEAGTPLGQYFTSEPPASSIQVRIDSAVKPQWIDPSTGVLTGTSHIDTVYAIELPAGTTIYTGPAGFQEGIYVGGTEQIFVSQPWAISGVDVVDSWPIN